MVIIEIFMRLATGYSKFDIATHINQMTKIFVKTPVT